MITLKTSTSIWIDPNFRFSYLSIPKCGCTSVKSFLRKVVNPGDPCESIHDIRTSPLILASDLPENKLEDVLSNSFCFTIIRDPKARVLSAYLDKFKLLYPPNLKVFLPQLVGHDFDSDDDRIKFASSLTFFEFLSYVKNSNCKNEHWNPYYESISDLKSFAPNLAVFPIHQMRNTFLKLETLLQIDAPDGVDMSPVRPQAFGHTTQASSKLDQYFNTQKLLDLFNEIYSQDEEIWHSVESREAHV